MAMFDDWTLDELKGFRKELSEAMVSGAMRVRFADREIQYTTMADLERAMARLDQAITERENGGTKKKNRVRVATRQGWC